MLDVDEFLKEESVKWAELRGRFEGLNAEALTKPGACGDWSPREVLIHIAAWHRHMADKLQEYGSGFGTLEPFTTDRIDEMNSSFVERFADWPLESILVLSRDAHTRAVVAIRASSFRGYENDWEKLIRVNTVEHYEEHAPMMDAFIKENS